jgi:deoxyadenosine/deoxycytidine kinase
MISFIKSYTVLILFLYIIIYLFLISFINNNKRKTHHIVVTGTIGGGKSTFIKYLKEFFEQKGLKVYVCEELAIKHKDALAHYYSKPNQRSFWFQSYLINMYEMFYKYELKEFENKYDIVIHDRSHDDTYFFTLLNITDQEELDFLDKERKKIKMYFDLVIYVNPGFEKSIEYKEKRDRQVEKNVDRNYLRKVFNIYEREMNNIYPNNRISFNSSVDLNEYYIVLQKMYNSGSFKYIV